MSKTKGLITFTVTPDAGDEYEVEAVSRDILNWERTTKGASFGKLADEQNMADLYKLAYFAAKRSGHFTGTQQEFEASNDLGFEMESEPDPTPPAA